MSTTLDDDRLVTGEDPGSSGEASTRIRVTKRDGSTEPYDADRINRAIERSAHGLPDAVSVTMRIAGELSITLFDGITTEQLDQAAIAVAVQNVKEGPEYDRVAARLLLKTIYKKVLGSYETDSELALLQQARFPGYVRDAVEDGLLDPRMAERFDLERLAAELDHTHDELLPYIGAVTLRNRYMVTDTDGTPREVPAYLWMRVAMGLCLAEDDPTSAAIVLYRRMHALEYLAAGSTLVNAGTRVSQLSNCFVMQMDDDMEHIASTMRDVMWVTKGTGGIGLSVTKLRCEGSPIRSNNTASTGPIPFMHTVDSMLRAVSRGGKKFGALCFSMENWHLDFPAFLDLRQAQGDPYRRTRTANTAVWLSDEFMKRVAANDDWYLFDPAECPDLVELVGAEFSARYAHYVERARQGKIARFQVVRAREQWSQILMSLQTTSHPWLNWKDTVNLRALNDNTGTIHTSNLCTEITLPQDRDNTAVCNLASINLARHLRRDEAGALSIDTEALAATARVAMRHLDNLVDVTRSSVPRAERSNAANRAVGLGIMGLTDVLEKLGIAYDSAEAADLVDEVFEVVSYAAIDASADLARTRGSYEHFEGSGWSKGLVPIDTLERVAADRGVPVDVEPTTRLDWDALRAKVAGGMRNATVMAVAPTASIGLVAGTSPGLDPQFCQIFSRSTSSGKFLEVNRNLVADLRELGVWEAVRGQLLAAQGDVQGIAEVPEHLKAVYRTSFQVDPGAFLTIAARAQKWVDQAISRNIYLESRDVDVMRELYQRAWQQGVKTTYYLHMKPRHQAEQSTVAVNKAASLRGGQRSGGFGFGRARKNATPDAVAAPASPTTPASGEAPAAPETSGTTVRLAPAAPSLPTAAAPITLNDAAADTCPTDPAERAQCEGCQ